MDVIKGYPSLGYLNHHKKQRHTIGQYNCHFDGCNKSYTKESAFKGHLRSHSDRVFSCDWDGCDYKTNKNFVLIRHKRLVHSNESIACHWPQCEKLF